MYAEKLDLRGRLYLFNKLGFIQSRICRLQESGLIDFETRMSSIPSGFGPGVDWEPEIPGELKLKPIATYNIIGVLVLLCAGILISLLSFVLENIYCQICPDRPVQGRGEIEGGIFGFDLRGE